MSKLCLYSFLSALTIQIISALLHLINAEIFACFLLFFVMLFFYGQMRKGSEQDKLNLMSGFKFGFFTALFINFFFIIVTLVFFNNDTIQAIMVENSQLFNSNSQFIVSFTPNELKIIWYSVGLFFNFFIEIIYGIIIALIFSDKSPADE